MAMELSLRQVRKSRRSAKGAPVEILCGVDLEVPGGQLTAIVGPSGGGKSTLVRLLNRLEDPDAGRILLGGVELERLPVLELRRRVGLMLQKPFMFPGSVLDNLQIPFLYRNASPPDAGDSQLLTLLDSCGLDGDFLEREARSLSIGQQQRVSLARTLLPGPELLVLDEPTSALDRPTGDRLAETLKRICRERQLTVVMVTHDLRLAGRVADHLAYLEAGRIHEAGPATTLLKSPRSSELSNFLAGGWEDV